MIRVLDRAVSIIDAVAGHSEKSLSEISREVALPCNTTLRILSSLLGHGFIEQSGHKSYRLGRRILSLSTRVPYPPSLVEVTRPALQALSHLTQEDVGLAVIKDGNALIIQKVMGPHPLKIIDNMSGLVPLHCGAFRKVLLAHQEPSWISDYLDNTQFVRFTDTTVMDRATIEKELAAIRQQGYSYSYGEYIQDSTGIAVPLFGLYNEFLACIFIICPRMRITEERIHDLVQELLKTARAVHKHICGEFAPETKA